MKNKVFAIGDIHGQIQLFEEMLTYWNEAEEQLVLMGDLGDRGENPKACFELGMKLVKEKQAIYLKGNHEDLLLNFMATPEERYENYVRNGGVATIESLLGETIGSEESATQVRDRLQEKCASLFTFFETLPLYQEWGDFIFVHAGVDLTLADWKETPTRELMWIREPFHQGKNQTGKTIVFGHTVTNTLHQATKDFSIWQSDGKIGIDGGAVYGGVLHGVTFAKDHLEKIVTLENKGFAWQGEQ
ncbi:metallophosphoesterase family protein [Isobaculum melis]|uniref:Serine/threonine protein phosphatase 1 n=1 Tax=Isobaculum melis TaxID=142588 RepID=A0A1H9SSX1_9LACT|nr:metallophosphoesterase family protein [Isobaculum melis]SER87935.1 serine/threonine protein phosphatase 1 [Isobaculum melis]